MIPIQFLIQRRIVTLSQSSSVQQAAKAMCKNDVGCILVTGSKGQLVGIVTDRDLACSVLRENVNGQVALSDVMTQRPVTVEASADLENVTHLMEESGIRRIPVVERREGEPYCIGLISLDDLIVSKFIAYDHLSRVVRSQIRRLNVLPMKPGEHSAERHPHRPLPLNRFFREIQTKTGLADQNLIDVTVGILSAVTRRLQFTGAAHFIGYLPETIQNQLLELPAGPDENINILSLISELQRRHGYDQRRALDLVHGFFEALSYILPRSEVTFLKSELPEDFASLFPSEAPESERRAA